MQHAGLLLAANSTTAIPLGATTTACLFHTTELAPPNTDTCDLPRPVRCQSLHYSSDKRFAGRYRDVPLLDPAAVSNWEQKLDEQQTHFSTGESCTIHVDLQNFILRQFLRYSFESFGE